MRNICKIVKFQSLIPKSTILKISTSNKDSASASKFENEKGNQDTHFGYQNVPLSKKQGLVDAVFSSVASSYDVMNDVMSLGIHRCWKSQFVDDIGIMRGSKETKGDIKVLDVASGTGDIALKIMENHKKNWTLLHSKKMHMTCSDINENMISEGQKRFQTLGYSKEEIEFKVANAEALPFEDETFDLYTISFGLRNVPTTANALKEAHRVLKKGGRFMCLEFSKVDPMLSPLYSIYTHNFIPMMGHLIANDYDSYKYLAESIDKWRSADDLLKCMSDADFSYSSYKLLNFGIVAIHSGFKI